MILNEFVKEVDKNQMISTLIKHYGVGNIKVKHNSMKDFAHFDVDRGTLELSTRYKKLKDSQVKQFLITMIHEIRHAMDAKKSGWKDFKLDYVWEMNYQVGQGKDPYGDNKYEIEAEEFGQKNWKQWYSKFKKQNLI